MLSLLEHPECGLGQLETTFWLTLTCIAPHNTDTAGRHLCNRVIVMQLGRQEAGPGSITRVPIAWTV